MTRERTADEIFWSAVESDLRVARAVQAHTPADPLHTETLRKIVSGEAANDVPLAQLGISGAEKEVLFVCYLSRKAKLDSQLFLRLLREEKLTVGHIKRSIALAQAQRQNRKVPARQEARAAQKTPLPSVRQAAQPASGIQAEISRAAPAKEKVTEGEETESNGFFPRRKHGAFAGALSLAA